MERKFMRKNEKITLCDRENGNKKIFTIIKKDGSGASSLSYLASYGSETGRLKEFYPSECYLNKKVPLVRKSDNQLSCVSDIKSASFLFEEMINDYLKSYDTLKKAMKEAEKGNNAFNTFISNFEVLRGCDNDGNIVGSVYIWTVDNRDNFETFAEYIKKVHKHPFHNPPKELFTILKTLYNLTECVNILHASGLIHGDIKPSNFGFSKRNGRYLTEQVKIFDIDSIYSVYTPFLRLFNTPGFCPPEVMKRKKSNQSDLYSIGATLFNAIVLCDDIPDSLYRDRYYDNIDEIIDESKFLNASPITSDEKVKKAISVILKKCLAKKLRDRIDSCSELKEDILKACALLVPYQYNSCLDLNSEIRIIDKELEKYNKSDSLFAFQNLLFNYPLYETAGETIKIMLLGFDIYARQFLDLCLELGQVTDKKLEVLILSCDANSDKKEYLKGRPALKSFFEINGEGDNSETSYGKLLFVDANMLNDRVTSDLFIKAKKGCKESNKAIIKNFVADNKDASYIFVSSGDEKLNKDIANACYVITKVDKAESKIAFVFSKSDKKLQKRLLPINVTAKKQKNSYSKELERLAFNTYLVKNNQVNLNSGLDDVRRKFRENDAFQDSLAFALSIKYLLHSVGIDMQKLSVAAINRVAEDFDCFIDACKDDLNRFVYAEHRRWVTRKIVQGWKQQTNFNIRSDGTLNNIKEKEHIYIVKSTEIGNGTDGLDIVSSKIYKTLQAYAKKARKEYSLNIEDSEQILSIIQGDSNAVIAFNKWLLCAKHIWNEDYSQIRLYESSKKIFLESVKKFPESELSEIYGNIKIIDAKIKPIVQICSEGEYKSSCKDLIRAIPFILTYRNNIDLFVPLMCGSTTERFNNIAAASLINPKSVTYGMYIKNCSDFDSVKESLKTIASYMRHKEIRSVLNFVVIFCEKEAKVKAGIDALKTFIAQLNRIKIGKISCISVADEAQICSRLHKEMKTNLCECNLSYLSMLLMKNKFFCSKSYYEFDSFNKNFIVTEKCRWLKYINCEDDLSIMDIFSFENADGNMASLPECASYDKLWGFYMDNKQLWLDLCERVSAHFQERDLIADFISTDKNLDEKIECVVPDGLHDGYNYVVSLLRDKACVISKNSCVEYGAMETCHIVLFVHKHNLEAAKRLFIAPFNFYDYKDLSVYESDDKIYVYFNNLIVSNMQIKSETIKILKILEKEKYIFNLDISGEEFCSFIFSSRQVKYLFSEPSNLIKLYLYSKLSTSGYDTVVSGYEINWGKIPAELYFDCIYTEGFRTVMVKCASEKELSDNFFMNVSKLADMIGINAIPVVVTSTAGTNFTDTYEKFGVHLLSFETESDEMTLVLKRFAEADYKKI